MSFFESGNARKLRGKPVSATAPTNGQVLTYNSGTGLWEPGAGASVPAGAPPLPALTAPPALASLTWVNQGSATSGEATGYFWLKHAKQGAAATDVHMLVKSIGANTKLTTVQLSNVFENFNRAGLVLRESATGKFLFLGVHKDAGQANLVVVDRWTNATTYSATQKSQPIHPSVFSGGSILRVEYDLTNLKFYVSADGVNFDEEIYSEAKNAFLTTAPDEWGVAIDVNSTGRGVATTVISWLEA